ncbi:hypothetical protein E8E14_007699 [Neopestalotiopsis sp. 37M]|nr:hypothetical protein E8E14_007699 [Neopestalotiopsis sp. 37M]
MQHHTTPPDAEMSDTRDPTFGMIRRLTCACLQILAATDRALKEAGELPRQRILLTRATQALMLWNDRNNVLLGELDEVLSRSKRLQRTVVHSLGMIAREITTGIHERLPTEIKDTLATVAGKWYSELQSLLHPSVLVLGDTDDLAASGDARESSWDDDDDNDDLQSHLNTLSSYVRSLLDLDSALNTPAIDIDAQKSSARRISALAEHHHYSLRIRDLFPLVGDSLADLLGQSNYRRYWQLQKEKPELKDTTKIDQLTQSIPTTLLIEQNTSNQTRNDYEDDTVFHDSGIGTSIPTETGYAKSHISSNVSAMGKGNGNLFPALSREAKAGIPFECSACGRQVKVTRQHLINDLKPYICIHQDCSTNTHPYPSRDAWINHMERNHKTSDLLTDFICPFCHEVKEGETRGILTHVSKHLEDIAAVILPRDESDSADLLDSDPSEASTIGASTEGLQVQISNIPSTVTEESLSDLFSRFGQIEDCLVYCDDDGQSLGRALIRFTTAASAKNAVATMNEHILRGFPILVELKAGFTTDGVLLQPEISAKGVLISNTGQSLMTKTDKIEFVLLHELAAGNRGYDYLKIRFFDDTFETVLRRIAEPVEGRWQMKPESWRDLDVWRYQYIPQTNRQVAIRNASLMYDRLGLDLNDPARQRLLKRDERGTFQYSQPPTTIASSSGRVSEWDSEWHSAYPPSNQTQYPSEYYGTEQQWYPDDNGYSTGYIEPSTSYIMSPVDNMDPMNFQFPQSMSMPMSMSMPRNDPMVSMQDSVVISEVEVPDASHMCTVPGCESKTFFKRKADLMRHIEQIHQAPEQKKQFYCDYSTCDRSQDPFGRIDHFRQHYRDFHGEDLPRKSGESAKWYADKKQSVAKRSWRCVKCLNKVNIKDSGFTCNNCNTPCETQRRHIRGYTS